MRRHLSGPVFIWVAEQAKIRQLLAQQLVQLLVYAFYYSIVQTDDCMQFLLSVPVPISDSSVPFSRSSPPS